MSLSKATQRQIRNIEETYPSGRFGQLSSLPDSTGSEDGYYIENKKIVGLRLSGTGIEEMLEKLHASKSLTNLRSLYLDDSDIWDLSILENFVRITHLSLNSNHIDNISALENLSQLKELDLGDNSIIDISALKSLLYLEYLSLYDNNIKDISALEYLGKLKFLDLDRNAVENIAVLENIVSIEKLHVEGNAITDISALRHLTKLAELHLSHNQIEDISVLENILQLEVLSLSVNPIKNISVLKKHINLKEVYLISNEIKDVTVFENMTEITALYLADNLIKDISSLKHLTKLEYISLENNEIENISVFENFMAISRLWLEDNYISDISFISHLTGIEFLFLQNNHISNISALRNFSRIKNLRLEGNQIRDISALENLKELLYLDLSNNHIDNITALGNLTKLTALYLNDNLIEDISSISKLKQLIGLYTSGNKIDDIKVVSKLRGLKHLDISNNRILNLRVLHLLSNLEVLNLSNNDLDSISSLCNISSLKDLDVSLNAIADLEPLSKLINIQALSLDNNLIIDCSSLKSLVNLRELNLSFNFIDDISCLETLTDLRTLNLKDNLISILPKWILNSKMDISTGLQGINLEDNPIVNVPVAFLKQGKQAIKDYFVSLKEGAQPISEIKVILLGEGAAGKTSLLNYLKGKPYNKNESQTHGINLEKCVLDNGVTIKLWDFGGQDIMHHTHQFFLTQQSVYVLVLNARENSDTEKWLKLIQVFGGDSPIIIVTNKIDENPSDHENIKHLDTKYLNLKSRYVRVSCEKETGLDKFKDLLLKTIDELLHVKTLWGNSWLKVKRKLEEMRSGDLLKDYIHFDKYEELCEEAGVMPKHRETLITWLHRLGVITYFPDLGLSETNVINPSWLTQAFYAIINSEIVAKNFGRFNLGQIEQILPLQQYPLHKHSFLVSLMNKFELCYKIDDTSYLIPDLLNKEEPNFQFDQQSSLKFKFKYTNLLPKSVFPKLMVRRHQEIKDDIKWRTGIFIHDTNYESNALIRVDEEDKEILIYVNGKEKRGYLASIITNIENINGLYEGIECEKLVPCCCAACIKMTVPYYYEYDILQNSRKNGRKNYICKKSDLDVPINDLLGILISKEEMEREIEKVIGIGAFQTKKDLDEGNIDRLIRTLKSLYGSISYLLYEKSEKAYHTPLFMLLRAIYGSEAGNDVIQSKGRADIILELENQIYIIELKLDSTAQHAIDQINSNRYYEPYLIQRKKIVLVGINFSSTERNISEFIFEESTRHMV
jgi:small GTP-binding protein